MKLFICPCRISSATATTASLATADTGAAAHIAQPEPATLRAPSPSYAQCCQPWHTGLARDVHAPTPELLMRARYSAYALATHNNPHGHAMLDYLHATWHVSSAPGDLELSPTQWLALDIVNAQHTLQAGVVEFVAHYKAAGVAHTLHEVSRFVVSQDAGAPRWWYIDGHVSDD